MQDLLKNFSLEGKVAWITGASYGLGLAYAVAFAESGAKIVFNDINQDLVDKGLEEYKKRPDKAGWTQHKVTASDTLIRIANKYKIPDYHKIIEWNPHIDPQTNMIRAGEYLWIKQ